MASRAATVRSVHRLSLRAGKGYRSWSSSPVSYRKTPSNSEWSLIGGADHKPSLGGSSMGHLISELSATKPGMEALREEGQTILEEHRTQARSVAKWMIGLPLTFGTVVVAYSWLHHGPTGD
ncbi:hypothetical protein BAUCODRAFT_32036 [Baudoinia panamericana UAMH 10762]|uniref:Uncharacterized protein n=1 Tax=Baudoinia panamericana (strain UAMH 10762) TaxID=717646 RepID=M2NGC8_BAUPA|nr:uncharacterized protein BAUCODRAFT_32036 [Baudoinia panamericana UAMH 10762]EMC98030.1 hypothetical protein BAUCODRAFT_32036 [Baudoinia panamericana UAMH 10762]